MILPVNLGAADSAEVIIKSNGLLIALKGLLKILKLFLPVFIRLFQFKKDLETCKKAL